MDNRIIKLDFIGIGEAFQLPKNGGVTVASVADEKVGQKRRKYTA